MELRSKAVDWLTFYWDDLFMLIFLAIGVLLIIFQNYVWGIVSIMISIVLLMWMEIKKSWKRFEKR